MSAVPIYRPHIETRPQLKVVSGVRPSLGKRIVAEALGFSVIVLFVFGASSLLGHVKVEEARRDGIRAEQRMKVATNAQSILANQIEALSNTDQLKRWALNNGFVAPDVEAPTSLKNGVYARR